MHEFGGCSIMVVKRYACILVVLMGGKISDVQANLMYKNKLNKQGKEEAAHGGPNKHNCRVKDQLPSTLS